MAFEGSARLVSSPNRMRHPACALPTTLARNVAADPTRIDHAQAHPARHRELSLEKIHWKKRFAPRHESVPALITGPGERGSAPRLLHGLNITILPRTWRVPMRA